MADHVTVIASFSNGHQLGFTNLTRHINGIIGSLEIGTYNLRLIKHNKVAIDFNSSYDAFIAQDHLDGTPYPSNGSKSNVIQARITQNPQLMPEKPKPESMQMPRENDSTGDDDVNEMKQTERKIQRQLQKLKLKKKYMLAETHVLNMAKRRVRRELMKLESHDESGSDEWRIKTESKRKLKDYTPENSDSDGTLSFQESNTKFRQNTEKTGKYFNEKKIIKHPSDSRRSSEFYRDRSSIPTRNRYQNRQSQSQLKRSQSRSPIRYRATQYRRYDRTRSRSQSPSYRRSRLQSMSSRHCEQSWTYRGRSRSKLKSRSRSQSPSYRRSRLQSVSRRHCEQSWSYRGRSRSKLKSRSRSQSPSYRRSRLQSVSRRHCEQSWSYRGRSRSKLKSRSRSQSPSYRRSRLQSVSRRHCEQSWSYRGRSRSKTSNWSDDRESQSKYGRSQNKWKNATSPGSSCPFTFKNESHRNKANEYRPNISEKNELLQEKSRDNKISIEQQNQMNKEIKKEALRLIFIGLENASNDLMLELKTSNLLRKNVLRKTFEEVGRRVVLIDVAVGTSASDVVREYRRRYSQINDEEKLVMLFNEAASAQRYGTELTFSETILRQVDTFLPCQDNLLDIKPKIEPDNEKPENAPYIMQDMENGYYVHITMQDKRTRKYILVVKKLLKRMFGAMSKLTAYIDIELFVYVMRINLETQITKVLEGVGTKLKSKAILALYRNKYLQENDGEMVFETLCAVWSGKYNDSNLAKQKVTSANDVGVLKGDDLALLKPKNEVDDFPDTADVKAHSANDVGLLQGDYLSLLNPKEEVDLCESDEETIILGAEN